MDLPRRQRTIARPTRVTGFGYWSGRDVTVEFRPAPVHTGLVFVRRDLCPVRRVAALSQFRVEALRRTNLQCGSASVQMVEHVLASLAGLQIDNCEIWVDQPEMPGLDGSSQPMVECLSEARILTQNALRPVLVIRQAVRVQDGDAWVEARPDPRPGLAIDYDLDYGPGNPIGHQHFQTQLTPDTFVRELAPARTFLLRQEAEWLRQQGIARRATCQDLIVFDHHGPIDNVLRFSNECVRHKAMDLIGDLALAGCDLHGRFVAHRSGHRLNAELVGALLSQYGTTTRELVSTPACRRVA